MSCRARRKQQSKRTELTQDEVIEGLRSARDAAMRLKQISGAVRALELLGKHQSMFEDKVKLDQTVNERPSSTHNLEHLAKLKAAKGRAERETVGWDRDLGLPMVAHSNHKVQQPSRRPIQRLEGAG